MAHKKAGGSSSNGRDSNPKYRGVKRSGGQSVAAGGVLIRQKGFWYRPGANTHLGKDWTIHASVNGTVAFSKKRITKFNGKREHCTFVHVEPTATEQEVTATPAANANTAPVTPASSKSPPTSSTKRA